MVTIAEWDRRKYASVGLYLHSTCIEGCTWGRLSASLMHEWLWEHPRPCTCNAHIERQQHYHILPLSLSLLLLLGNTGSLIAKYHR
jgi:hypothetical protein